MTLLVTVFAAIITTLIWYFSEHRYELRLGSLCLMYWGAAIMWFADAIYEYAELKADYFLQAPSDMLNDFYLGLAVVALGLIIWLVGLLIKDPKGIIKESLLRKGN